ncbi:MAG: hypothetical protein R3Y58_11990 [Eubacteriales bacterium]
MKWKQKEWCPSSVLELDIVRTDLFIISENDAPDINVGDISNEDDVMINLYLIDVEGTGHTAKWKLKK